MPHDQDCIACRMEALDMTDDQQEFVMELIRSALVVGYEAHKVYGSDEPTAHQIEAMLGAASRCWAKSFGTFPTVPESAEVRDHAKGFGK